MKKIVSVLLVYGLLLGGCATILNDPDQMIAFSSEPEGATVAVDSIKMGNTPCVLPVPRKGWDKMITFSKKGYKTVNYPLKNSMGAAVWGNILLGGVIGGVVDGISGRGGEYQKSVSVVLEPGEGVIDIAETSSNEEAKEEGVSE